MLGERTLRQKITNHVVLCLLSFFMIFPLTYYYLYQYSSQAALNISILTYEYAFLPDKVQ